MKLFLQIAICLFCQSLMAQTYQSIDSVLASVSRNNIELKALQNEHEAEVLEGKADNVLGAPSVEYSPFFRRGYSGLAESELIVSEEIDFPTKYVARNRQLSLRKNVLEQQFASARRDILLKAKLLCIDIICINQSLEMQQRRLKDSEATLNLFQKRVDAGDANILELNKVKIERMDVQKMVSSAQSERLSLLQQLQELNGGVAIDITENHFPEQPLALDFESFLSQTLYANTDILAAEATLKATDHEVSMARQEWLPNISVGYRRNTAEKESVNGFMVGLSFPLFSTSDKVKAARKRQLSSQLQIEQVRQSTESALRSRYNQLLALRQVLNHDDVEMMQETIQLLNKALQHGELSAIQYYNEVSSIYEKLQSHINTHCQSAKLYAELMAY